MKSPYWLLFPLPPNRLVDPFYLHLPVPTIPPSYPLGTPFITLLHHLLRFGVPTPYQDFSRENFFLDSRLVDEF
jgi:hypothetical protein